MSKIQKSSREIKNTYLTSKGLSDARIELEYLKKTKRVQIAERIHQAREYEVITEKQTTDFIVIGSTVKIEMDDGIDEFKIVGRVEADPSKKRISNECPLGMALLGAKKGEEVDVATPIVRYKCKVLEIK